jgi:hypothetical protein
MQNLSGLAVNSMWVTSQEGGNLVHDNSGAMTAPGSRPVTPMPPVADQPDPTVTPLQHDRVVTARPHQAHQPAPWTASDGTPWKQATDQEYLKIARGQWNEV